MTDSERITAIETELRALKELIGAKWESMHQAWETTREAVEAIARSVAELQRPKGINWSAVSVCIAVVAMICSGSLVWLKMTIQPLEMEITALKKENTALIDRVTSVRSECVREHQWNWDGHKQRIDTIAKQQERQEALIRLILGERLESYEKRIQR